MKPDIDNIRCRTIGGGLEVEKQQEWKKDKRPFVVVILSSLLLE
jgi:hypothetical protein